MLCTLWSPHLHVTFLHMAKPWSAQDLFQLPGMHQVGQMASALFSVAAHDSPVQLLKSLFSFVLRRLI